MAFLVLSLTCVAYGKEQESSVPARSARERPFTNSLGMKFVSVPGTKVLFSIWDTRVKDYAAFARATKRSIEKPDFSQTPTDPAVMISWQDAKAFCKWLTEMEKRKGTISADAEYRLPTDAEWSMAVGLPEETGKSPEEKSASILDVYPWGTQWPAPQGAGNYDPSMGVDSFAHTSPVGHFAANSCGLHDMGGNVWQWCEDWYSDSKTSRVLRGGSWPNRVRVRLNSSYRFNGVPNCRGENYGFRCVLAGRNSSRP